MEKQKKGVRLEHISKIYNDPKTGKEFYAVQDTTLDIEPGTFVTLLGPSGCGKTTTLRMIAGFEEASAGVIKVEGERIEDKEPFQRNVNTVFQNYALFPHMTVFNNVAYGLTIKKVPKPEILSLTICISVCFKNGQLRLELPTHCTNYAIFSCLHRFLHQLM